MNHNRSRILATLLVVIACAQPATAQSSDETAKRLHLLPHIADGDGWKSLLLVTNVAQSAGLCTLDLHGLPLDRFENISRITAAGSTATFELDGPGGYLVWGTRNESALASGYAILDCTVPVVAQVVFASISESGTTTGMATVFSAQAATVFQFPVLTPEATLGFAIANNTNVEANCHIILESPQRVSLGETKLFVPSKSNRSELLLNDAISIPKNFPGGSATVRCNQQVSVIGLHFELRPDRTIVTFNTLPPAVLDTAPQQVTANRPPETIGAIPALTLTAGGTAVSASVARYFHDPDGDRLIYEAESSDAATVTALALSDDTIQLTPRAAGKATVTITARDTEGQAARQTMQMTVNQQVTGPLPNGAPPNWVFAGDVPETEQTMLRAELEHSRAYFADKFGVTATGFTVLVGENYEALALVYRDAVGRDLSDFYHQEAKFTYAWVTSSAKNSAVMTLIYGLQNDAFSSLKHYIAHEYFHVLQGQLASGFSPLQNGEIGWHTNSPSVAPQWLVEGLASYADYKYTPSRSDRRLFYDRYSPFDDLGWFQINDQLNYGDLARTVSYPNALCAFEEHYFYPLSFVAALFLAEQAEEDSYVEFWKLLGEHSTWQQAFEEAFGTGINDFYMAFEEWLPSQIPSYDQVTIQMFWPDMEANPPIPGEFLYLWTEGLSWGGNSNPDGWWLTGSRGPWTLPLILTFTYPAGGAGMAIFTLWWSDDQITEHLLGWYKDGELTDQPTQATPVEFTGSESIEWTLPAHPNTLPRLKTRTR